jgi:hypothetical protein
LINSNQDTMDKLWDTSCITASTNDVEHMTSLGLQSNISTAAEEKTFHYHRGIKDPRNDKPTLVLLHGYPQTSFMCVLSLFLTGEFVHFYQFHSR